MNPHLEVAIEVLWVLIPMYIASATATIPRGRGPPMDLGHIWRSDGRRILGPSKTWGGFFFGSLFALPFALLEAGLVLAAPPSLQIVPSYGATLVAAVPVGLLLTFGAMSGDALGSFLKRRMGRESGARTVLLDQLPFVLLPIGIGLILFPATFVPAFLSLEGLAWLLVYTVALHAAFNWVGYWVGLKKVPW
ncbi:MAG: CDP-archaeol synthase [Thermoplasmata archaeon]|nr:CDP-archaeol synthase [Thermoplasmata archaeon]